MNYRNDSPGKAGIRVTQFVFWLAIILFIIVVGIMLKTFLTRDAYYRSATSYALQYGREAAVLIETQFMSTQTMIPDRPYWGPFEVGMIQQLGGDPGTIIDPYNHDGPKTLWRQGPRYDDDPRGATINVRGMDFWYYTNGRDYYALVSRGPDGDLDVSSSTLQRTASLVSRSERMLTLAPFEYDPSNGTISHGDIIRLRE